MERYHIGRKDIEVAVDRALEVITDKTGELFIENAEEEKGFSFASIIKDTLHEQVLKTGTITNFP